MEKIVFRAVIALITVVSLHSTAMAGPKRHYYGGGGDHTAVGIRLGWVGAPNGFTYRKSIDNHAFEFIAGYNMKYGRHTDNPFYRKGNSFIGASWAPHITVYDGNIAVGLYLDFGTRINIHHYRSFAYARTMGSPITLDALGGLGMQIEFSESVEVFADMHVKYYHTPGSYWAPGVESGAGIRFWLN